MKVYLYTGDRTEYYCTPVSNIHGFLKDDPLISRGMVWIDTELRAISMSFHIELPKGRELSWAHILNTPFNPVNFPIAWRNRDFVCSK